MKKLGLIILLLSTMSSMLAQQKVLINGITTNEIKAFKSNERDAQSFLKRWSELVPTVLLRKLGVDSSYLDTLKLYNTKKIIIDSMDLHKKILVMEYLVSDSNKVTLVKDDFYGCWNIAYLGKEDNIVIPNCPVSVLNVNLPEGLLTIIGKTGVSKYPISILTKQIDKELYLPIRDKTITQIVRVKDIENINIKSLKSGKFKMQTKLKTGTQKFDFQQLNNNKATPIPLR